MGGHGIYYRAALPHLRTEQRHVSPIHRNRDDRPPPIPDGTLGQFESIESADATKLIDSSSEQLLAEISKKQAQMQSWPWAAAVSVIAVGLGIDVSDFRPILHIVAQPVQISRMRVSS
jgi:hypothetical protein